MKKIAIIGEKGKTVCYTINNFRYENESICWESFNFYTPLGVSIDTEGHAYFEVPAISEIIQRDETLNKEVLIKVTQAEGIEIIEILEGAAPLKIAIGLEGDIVCMAYVPADLLEDIQISYKEVTNG